MKNVFIGLLLAISAFATAQHNLSGQILDRHNNPIPGASIYFPEFNKGVTADREGRFVATSFPGGRVTISVSMIGFTSVQLEVAVPTSSEISIKLDERAHQMDEVIVSTSFNRLQSQNVMKVEQASLASMRGKGSVTLAEGIATIPGVNQLSTGISIGKPVIRGLTGNRVLVYSQGIRMENQQFGEEHGLGLSEYGVESAEVIKGPASLLYGSDALGGVLYLNPEKFADAGTFTSDVSQRLFSNTLGSSSSIGVKTSREHWKFLARGSYATHSDYKISGGERVTNTRFHESDFKAGIGYGNSAYSGILRYNFSRQDIGLPESIGLQSASKSLLFPNQNVSNHILSLSNNIFIGEATLEFNLGYTVNDRKEFEEEGPPELHMNLRTLNYDFKYKFPKSNKFSAIAGVQGMHQQNGNFGMETLIPDATVSDFGLFATGIYSWKSNAIQAGIRYDHRNLSTEEDIAEINISRNFNSVNASAGLKTGKDDGPILRINFATGFRAPNLSELSSNGVHEGSNRYEIGNEELSTENNFQVDVNIEAKLSHFEFFANGFYNRINNYIYLNPTGETIDDAPVYEYSQDDAALFGGEAGFHFHPHPFDFLHIESALEIVRGKMQNGSDLPLIPPPS